MTLPETSVRNGAARRFVVLRRVCLSCLVSLCALLSACASVSSTPHVVADAGKNWALLPFDNFSPAAQAGSQLSELVETALRSRGIRQISIFRNAQTIRVRSIFDDSAQRRVASQWAREQSQDYAVTGSVHEWQYQPGTSKEPRVGLTLQLLDVKTGEVLWQGNAASTGAGSNNLQTLAGQLVEGLFSQITVSSTGS